MREMDEVGLTLASLMFGSFVVMVIASTVARLASNQTSSRLSSLQIQRHKRRAAARINRHGVPHPNKGYQHCYNKNVYHRPAAYRLSDAVVTYT